mgnify:CR=1 FL=1
MIRKDMTKKEFDAACKRRGFIKPRYSWLGYYELPCGLMASIENATTRREQLKYLIHVNREWSGEHQHQRGTA